MLFLKDKNTFEFRNTSKDGFYVYQPVLPIIYSTVDNDLTLWTTAKYTVWSVSLSFSSFLSYSLSLAHTQTHTSCVPSTSWAALAAVSSVFFWNREPLCDSPYASPSNTNNSPELCPTALLFLYFCSGFPLSLFLQATQECSCSGKKGIFITLTQKLPSAHSVLIEIESVGFYFNITIKHANHLMD